MEAIKVITLPPYRYKEYRALRLEALQNDPTSFARTYAEDAALPDAQWLETIKKAEDGKTVRMLFAESDAQLVGMVGAIISQGEKVGHIATIIAMYAKPAFRGKGIGKQLLQTLVDQLAQQGIVHVRLNVNTNATAAIKLYETMGFKKIGILEKALKVSDKFYDEWVMVKILQ